MSDTVRAESPLAQFLAGVRTTDHPDGAGVRLRERPFLGHLDIRGDPADRDFLKRVAAVLGVDLPLEPNTVAESEDVTAMWLGPDEWLLLTPPGLETALAEALAAALVEKFASVVDLSGGQTVVNVSGDHARDVLAKGCTLDLHPRAFGPGRCAQTLVSKAGVTIRQLDESPSFDLIVRRSFAGYLAQWLEDAAQEYGLAVEAADGMRH